MRSFLATIVLVCSVLGLSAGSASSEPSVTTLVISGVSVSNAYSAALRAVKQMDFEIKSMEFEVKTSDQEVGLIRTQYKNAFGELNTFLDIDFNKVGGKAEVTISISRLEFAVGGGKSEERLEQFRTLFSQKLGDKVTVVVKKEQ